MNRITSRKNAYISHVRALASDGTYRGEKREFICDGIKTLREALTFGAEVVSVLWKDEPQSLELPDATEQYVAAEELFDYASPMKNSRGPLFAVRYAHDNTDAAIKNAIVLENVQDPGNVGTVIRTSNAFGIGAVILVGECADLYNPKTVRSTMGAIFRQRVIRADIPGLKEILTKNKLPLYGAALAEGAADVRTLKLSNAAVAVGSEGNGLSGEFMAQCEKLTIIPMRPDSESLNAAVAASVIMWEMYR